jgi:predicted dehydrogenase/threonine dehydrogenase-like Zn-dependent dehydrogenase
MKQVFQSLRTGDTKVVEVPIPTPQPGQALVRTVASLVSAGTERMLVEFAEKSLIGKARSRPDLLRQVLDKARREGLLTTLDAAFNRLDQPMPLGYSSAGEIVALGEGMSGFQVGQRVACAGGGYAVHAEYAVVPRNLMVLLPDDVDYETGAFTTLGAIALHGFRLSETALGEHVAVIGLGLLGMLMVGIGQAAGCKVLGVDIDTSRVELAIKLGAQAVMRGQAEEAIASFSHGRGCDAVLICADTSSSDPVELAGLLARDRARVVAVGAVGLEMPRKVYFEKELTFVNSRSYGPGRYDPAYEEAGDDYPIGYVRWTEGRNLEAVVDLMADRHLNVSQIISHRFPIDQAPKAYRLITGKDEQPFLGVLLTYPQIGEVSDASVDSGEKRTGIEIPTVPSDNQRTAVDGVRLGVLGAGNFAMAVMLPAVKKTPGVKCVGIASATGQNAQHAANKFGFQYADSSAERIIEDPEINTVAILTRHHLHHPQVLASLAAGKHVFCEKPLVLNRDQLQDIAHALDGDGGKSKPLLMVGFNRRFAPLALKLKEFLGDCSEPMVAYYRINAGAIPLDHWVHDPEQGGGRIIGEVCHFVDFLTYLVGETPVTVSTNALPDSGHYREDNVVMTYTFPERSLGTVSYLANGDKAYPKERVEVFCGGRIAVLDDFRSLELIYDGKRKVHRARLAQDKGHRAEWEAFSASLLGGGQPPVPYDQIFGVMQATFAAQYALRQAKSIKI